METNRTVRMVAGAGAPVVGPRIGAVAENAQNDSQITAEAAAPRPVLVIDFGAQYAQLIARRVREARVYSEVIPHTATVEEIRAKDPVALILSGGPASVYAQDAPVLDPAVLDLGLPVFGICYGFQTMAGALGGAVEQTGSREYGRADMTVSGGLLHAGLPESHPVWMSHGDAVTTAPEGFTVTGKPMSCATSQASSGDATIWPSGTGTPQAASRRLVKSLSWAMPSAMALVWSDSAVQMRRCAAP